MIHDVQVMMTEIRSLCRINRSYKNLQNDSELSDKQTQPYE